MTVGLWGRENSVVSVFETTVCVCSRRNGPDGESRYSIRVSWCETLSVLSDWGGRSTVLVCHGVRDSLYYQTGLTEVQY